MAVKPEQNIAALKKRLTLLLLGIFIFIFILIIAFSYFGPQIGSLFGFISKNRNQEVPEIKVALAPPSFVDVPDAINSNNITIQGFAESGNTVKLFLNGPEKAEIVVGSDGKFFFDNVELLDGRNSFFAKTVDQSGNTSDKSATFFIEVDTKSPKIEITEPKNGDTIKNLNNRVMVKGKISEKAKIRVNGKIAIQQPDLSFEFLLGVSKGDVEIKVSATDDAGNEKIEKIFIKYENN